jgi:hypothetical protein
MIHLLNLVFQSGLDLNVERQTLTFCVSGAKTVMHQGKLVFSQLMAYLPMSTFRRCVAKHRGEHKVKDFSCLDQFFAMAFAQLTYRESLRDIEVNLRAQAKTAVPHGLSLPDDFAQHAGQCERHTPVADLCGLRAAPDWHGRPLYAKEPFGHRTGCTVYAFDASTIDLCLSVHPWAPFRSTKAAIKLHTLLDLHGSIPSFIHITDGKTHEVNVLDDLVLEQGRST